MKNGIRVYKEVKNNGRRTEKGKLIRIQTEIPNDIRLELLNKFKKEPDEWKKFALPIKVNNVKRQAFQDEFAKVISDWNNLLYFGKQFF